MRAWACALALLAAASFAARGESAAQPPSFFPEQAKPAAPAPAPEKPKPAPGAKEETPALSVDEALDKLDLRGRIAQLMLVTLQGSIGPNSEDIKYLRDYTPGGAIMWQASLPTEAQLYVARVHAAEALSGIPILVGCDLYALSRADRAMPSQYVQIPSLLSLAAARDSGSTERFAKLMADHFRGMGFDFSLGPSLELAPVIHDAVGSIYTFGSSPSFAADAGATVIGAMRDAGVAAVPLGFPGGGGNRRPKEPAVLLTARAEILQEDALPYARAIAEGAKILHVGNTLVPTLDDAGGQACLTPAVYRLLREDMGYDGLVIAGPIDSEDVARQYDSAEAAARALYAGADLIYFGTTLNAAARAVDKLTSAVETGEIPRELVDRAARRVLAFKVARREAKGEGVKLADAKALEKKGLAEEAYAVERKSITLVKNTNGVLPLSREKSTPAGITGVVGTDLLVDLLQKPLKNVAQQPISTAKHLGEIQDFEIERLTAHVQGINTAVVVLTDKLRVYGEKKLVHALKEKGAKVVVVFLGYPGNARELLEADAIILAYCEPSNYGQTLRAVADVLLGKPAISLRSDLGVIEAKAGQSRRFNALDIVRAPAGRLPLALGAQFPAGQSVSYGGDALAKKAEWDFGDGNHAKGLTAEYAYSAAGDYTLTVRVHGGDDEVAEQAYRVSVTP